MHSRNITHYHLSEFGSPKIKKTFGLSYVHYQPGQIPGWKIAKSLHESNLLTEEAKDKVNEISPSSIEDWMQIAEIEKIVPEGYTPPEVTKFLDNLPRRARLNDITFDQDFTTTLYKVLESYAINSPGQNTMYPLLDGPPGASKSIVVFVAAALLNVPVYTVTGSDGAADEIKISLLGGDNASGETILGIVKKYAYQGWLHNPLSLKIMANALHKHGHLDSIPDTVFETIAARENIRENITCYSPGAYQLAAKNGGILFLDEINGFRGVTTVLTEILENYTVDQHPNFFIMGALNPAGEKHDREPLPPEIRSRTSTIYVTAPSNTSYYQMLTYLFSGKQPTITLPNGKKGIVTPQITGFPVAPKMPTLFQRALDKTSFNTFIKNLSNAHKIIEEKYEEGIIDPATAAVPQTMETSSVDRRMLVRSIATLESLLHQAIESADDLSSGEIEYTDLPSEEELTDNTAIDKTIITNAATRMFERIYLDPFNFKMDSVEIQLSKDKSNKRKFSNGSDIVRAILEFNKLTPEHLMEYINTAVDLKVLKKAWEKELKDIIPTTQVPSIIDQAAELNLVPKSTYLISPVHKKGSTTADPQRTGDFKLHSLTYLDSVADTKNYMDQYYPNLSLKKTSKATPAKIISNRVKSLKSNQRLITISEMFDSASNLMPEHYEKIRNNSNSIYFTPITLDLGAKQDTYVLITVPLSIFPDQDKIIKEYPFTAKKKMLTNRILIHSHKQETNDSLSRIPLVDLISYIFVKFLDKEGEELDFSGIKHIVPIDMIVNK